MAFSDLAAYIEKLREIDAPMQSVFYWYKEEILKLLTETFEKGENPYQKKWAPRRRYYPHPILDKTGNLKESNKVSISGDSYTISNNAKDDSGIYYASYHQYGTKLLPVRQIIPEVEIPEHWKEVLEDYFLAKLQEYLE